MASPSLDQEIRMDVQREIFLEFTAGWADTSDGSTNTPRTETVFHVDKIWILVERNLGFIPGITMIVRLSNVNYFPHVTSTFDGLLTKFSKCLCYCNCHCLLVAKLYLFIGNKDGKRFPLYAQKIASNGPRRTKDFIGRDKTLFGRPYQPWIVAHCSYHSYKGASAAAGVSL